jgi:MarR family 2-MHQ and catechol resistance regulon transcriptional repressor
MKKNEPDSTRLIKRIRRLLSRLSRFTNQLQRHQLSCGPVTVQQCSTLEALVNGPLPMKKLAAEVALHQSTLTRVVEKLEEKTYVVRHRPAKNQRVVEVALTENGRQVYSDISASSTQLIGRILELLPKQEWESAAHGLEVLCDLLDPQNKVVQQIISGCCCSDLQTITKSRKTEK